MLGIEKVEKILKNRYDLHKQVNSNVVEQAFLLSTLILLVYLLTYISGKGISVQRSESFYGKNLKQSA